MDVLGKFLKFNSGVQLEQKVEVPFSAAERVLSLDQQTVKSKEPNAENQFKFRLIEPNT